MRGWLFHILAATSLLLCLAMAAWWVRSYFVADKIEYERPIAGVVGERRIKVSSVGGFLWVFHQYFDRGPATGGSRMPTKWNLTSEDAARWVRWSPMTFQRHWGPFAYTTLSQRWTDGRPIANDEVEVLLPHAALVLLLAFMPACWALWWRRDCRRRLAGRCRYCGYDLRATPDRCPECGQVVSAPATMATAAQVTSV